MGFTPAEIVEAQYAKDLWVKITLEGEKNYWAKGDLVAAAVKSPMTGPHTLDVIVGLISHHSEIFSLYGHTVKALIAHENLNPAALDQLEILCEKQVAEGKAETGKFQKSGYRFQDDPQWPTLREWEETQQAIKNQRVEKTNQRETKKARALPPR